VSVAFLGDSRVKHTVLGGSFLRSEDFLLAASRCNLEALSCMLKLALERSVAPKPSLACEVAC
jgi:hypothetical protein